MYVYIYIYVCMRFCEVERRVTQIRLVKARRQWNEILLYFVQPRCYGLWNRGRGRSKIFNRNLLKGSDVGGKGGNNSSEFNKSFRYVSLFGACAKRVLAYGKR